mmetsp:Transcript_18858/g.65727  ORF Transcript_18858/g.65727 Transcript_18858/m.65727 type:complete len:221 (+) Transcript_18858:751-1413(+)
MAGTDTPPPAPWALAQRPCQPHRPWHHPTRHSGTLRQATWPVVYQQQRLRHLWHRHTAFSRTLFPDLWPWAHQHQHQRQRPHHSWRRPPTGPGSPLPAPCLQGHRLRSRRRQLRRRSCPGSPLRAPWVRVLQDLAGRLRLQHRPRPRRNPGTLSRAPTRVLTPLCRCPWNKHKRTLCCTQRLARLRRVRLSGDPWYASTRISTQVSASTRSCGTIKTGST